MKFYVDDKGKNKAPFEALEMNQWIIDGNGMRTLEMRYQEADIAIYHRLSRFLCLYRIFYWWISTLITPSKDGPIGAMNSVS